MYIYGLNKNEDCSFKEKNVMHLKKLANVFPESCRRFSGNIGSLPEEYYDWQNGLVTGYFSGQSFTHFEVFINQFNHVIQDEIL